MTVKEALEVFRRYNGMTERYVGNKRVAMLAENGFTFCWGGGYQCADAILEVAEMYPDIHFAIIDNAYAETPGNVSGIVFRARRHGERDPGSVPIWI